MKMISATNNLVETTREGYNELYGYHSYVLLDKNGKTIKQ